jgi:hypothetical protein
MARNRPSKETANFKVGDIITLQPKAYYIKQLGSWQTPQARILDVFWDDGDFKTGWWYDIRVVAPEDWPQDALTYRNSYPEEDLMFPQAKNNMEAKRLLSKEW